MSVAENELRLSDKLASELTFQEEQFALEWLANGGNGMAAARAVGYAQPHVQGSQVLARPRVAAFIEARRTERRAEMDLALRQKHLSPDALVAMLSDMAQFDLGDILDGQGRIDRTKLKAAAKHLQAVEVDGAKTKIKTQDKLATIRLIMDALGMLKTSQTNVQVNVDFGDRMAARRARALEGR